MYCTNYYILLIFFKGTNEPWNQASLILEDRDFTGYKGLWLVPVHQCRR